ncbi:Esterase/lipase [Pseudidiomarina planktonica]|uniref:Esterase/lipase n=1 Tax=Pseudidiomarina planktonica TaxID=1323738 RepID=A0A1Y6E9R1_9GAMM|nr:alpha/beta hydrolase [Pseudidiomarina planktonica]RUO66267.1 alpha/beta hydrolase [Pseudidiomarina planktonica]SMQ59239.1 Esterase/lipase [Pseudidiomarina planktonica]
MLLKLFRFGFNCYARLFPVRARESARKLLMTPRLSNKPLRELNDLPNPEASPLASGGMLYSWYGGNKTAVFLHGWEGNYLQFQPLFRKLYTKGWSVHSIAAPGHKGAKESESHPIKFLDSLQEVAKRLDNIDLLVGYSMGAGVSAALGADSGDSTLSLPKKMVLIAPPSSFQNVLQRFCQFIGLPGSHQQAFISYVSDYVKRPVSELDLLVAGQQITAKTLVIHDYADKEIPHDEGHALAKAIPAGECMSTIGFGHRRVLKADSVIAKIVEFANT